MPTHIIDEWLDSESVNPGEQLFEKKTAGAYLGTLFAKLAAHCLDLEIDADTETMARIDADVDEAYKYTHAHAHKLQQLAFLVRRRAARLIGAAISASCLYSDSCNVGMDGSLVEKYKEFRADVEEAVALLRIQKSRPINCFVTRGGSGFGAALIAATVHQAGQE